MVTMVTTFFCVCCFAIRETTIVFLYMATTIFLWSVSGQAGFPRRRGSGGHGAR
jgi:hypothetical protein